MTTTNTNKILTISAKIENARKSARSAWRRGVVSYADELLESVKNGIEWHEEESGKPFELNYKALKELLLNGADDWKQYSWGGSSIIYDCEIAERLCTPSELKRTNGGEKSPNSQEQWLDTQARALHQASIIILRALNS
jgi:hypothetical protein